MSGIPRYRFTGWPVGGRKVYRFRKMSFCYKVFIILLLAFSLVPFVITLLLWSPQVSYWSQMKHVKARKLTMVMCLIGFDWLTSDFDREILSTDSFVPLKPEHFVYQFAPLNKIKIELLSEINSFKICGLATWRLPGCIPRVSSAGCSVKKLSNPRIMI